jgi:hypothetical protein
MTKQKYWILDASCWLFIRRIFKNLWGDYNASPVDASIILAATFMHDCDRFLNSPPYLERLWTPTASCPVVATWNLFQWKKGRDLEIIINNHLVPRVRMCERSLNFPVRTNGVINKRKEIFALLCLVCVMVMLMRIHFRGAFAKLRKAIISFVKSASPSVGLYVRME